MANTAALRYLELGNPARSLRQEPKFRPLQVRGLHKLFEKGLARGVIAEISGSRSSGRTSACFHILAQATAAGEICAIIDLYDSFHPASALTAGVRLEQLLWVRCRGNAEHAMRAADLLLHAGGFGVVLLDLCEGNSRMLNRVPLSYWYRFRRAIEHTPTILLICGGDNTYKPCTFFKLKLKRKVLHCSGKAPFILFRGIEASAILQHTSAIRTESLSIQTVA